MEAVDRQISFAGSIVTKSEPITRKSEVMQTADATAFASMPMGRRVPKDSHGLRGPKLPKNSKNRPTVADLAHVQS